VRLADFGLAVAGGGDGDATAGTPGYMPLEQLRGEPVDARADQFAFAVALFEALTGERPYCPHGASRAALEARLASGVPAEVPRLPGVPSALRRALVRSLAPAAADRFPSLAGLLEPLELRTPERRRPSAPVGLALLATVFCTFLAAAAIPLGPWAARDASEPGELAPEATAAPAVLPVQHWDARPGVRPPSPVERVAAAAPAARPAQPITADVAAPTAALPAKASSFDRSWFPTGGWARPNRDAKVPVPGPNPALDALVDSLTAMLKSLRSAIEGESRSLWAGPVMPALAPAEGARSPAAPISAAPGGGEGVQADGSALRVAAIGQLEQRLNDSIASGSPTDIAEARFELAQALAPDPGQHARALELAEQAQADLASAGTNARTDALRNRLRDWIEAHQTFHTTPGGNGGNLVHTDGADSRSLRSP
jgi:hypothetical protein